MKIKIKSRLLMIGAVILQCNLQSAKAQSIPYIKIDGISIAADPSTLKLPSWLKAGQTLAADVNVSSVAIMEFTITGTAMDFSQVINVTAVQTVPASKIWKIESVHLPNSLGSISNWSLLGNGGTTVGTNFLGTTDAKALVLKTNNAEWMRILSTGKVGIGTSTPASALDVAGEIKFGNTSSTCNSTNEGQQRYNATSHVMEFCNGTAWTAYGAGGGSVAVSAQTFTANGTYTPTAGTKYVIVHIVGGGAGGWNGGSGNYGGGGGGAGEYATGVFSAATIGASQAITIGTGGASNTAGTTTSIGALLTAVGAPVWLQYTGGSGGTGGTGTGLHVQGGSGADGIIQYLSGSYELRGGSGGASFFGSGGRGGVGNVDTGQPGNPYGSGGGGNGYSSSTWGPNAGAGAPGVVLIYEYQ